MRVTAVLGTIDTGIGVVGLTFLCHVEDRLSRSWSAKLVNARSEVVAALELGTGGWTTAWWPSVGAEYGVEYRVEFAAEGERLDLRTILSSASGLGQPSPTFQAGRLEWSAVPGAASYQCATASQSQAGHTRDQTCAVEASAGTMLLRAFNVDPTALDEAALPASFDVSERRLSWGTTSAGNFSSHAAIGPLHFGGTATGLATLVTVQAAGGAPPTEQWSVEITTPSGARLEGAIVAGTDRVLMWSYDVAPQAGQYEIVTKTQSGLRVSYWTTAVNGSGLGEVSQLSVTSRGSGRAELSFAAVPGAVAYYASAWDRALGTLVIGQWSTQTTVTFPNNTFSSGQEVDVYVTASSASVAPEPTIPTTISMSENTFHPVHFVAP